MSQEEKNGVRGKDKKNFKEILIGRGGGNKKNNNNWRAGIELGHLSTGKSEEVSQEQPSDLNCADQKLNDPLPN